MKIDFVISSFGGGGAERVMAILSNHFATLGHEVSIITFSSGEAYNLNSEITRVKLHSGTFKNHKVRSLMNLLSHYKNRDNRPDVLIAFNTFNNLIGIIIAKIRGIKIIVSEHNNYYHVEKPKFLHSLTKSFFYKFADYLTVLTAHDLEFYKRRRIKVMVMPNPCSFKPLQQNNHNREKIILAVGSLNRYLHKGFDNLITIVAPILNKFPEWKLKLIGGGDKGKEFLSSLIEKEGLSDKVIFTGIQDNVDEHMKNDSIYILTSRYEGLPMVLLEAMSQGMACIAYNCVTGPSDIIENSVNGILIEDQNIKDMQTNLLRLVQNEDLRTDLGDKALISLNRFSIEEVSKKWLNLFDKIHS